MADRPPSPPPPPEAGPPARPGMVTAAAALFFVGGGLQILFGLFALLASAVAAFLLIVAIVILALGALEIYVGTQILELHERGRSIGIVLAAVSAFFNLLFLFKRPFSGVIGLAIDAFIVYALVTNAEAFTP